MKVDAKKYNSRSYRCGQKLKDSLGVDKVKDDELTLVTYSSDVSPVPAQRPSCVAFPETRADVVEVLKTANECKTPITVMSGGVNVVGACIAKEGGIVIDLHRMDKIIEINTDSGYAVIEPGVNFDRFSAALAEKGFRCGIPTAPGGSTPLGNYISRPSGSLANRHLDLIQDLEVVLPDGTVLNTGSSQFPSVGSQLRYGPFPDMAGLFLCAYGTLGVITKAAIKIYPINEANRVHLTAFDEFENAVDYVKELINNNIPEHCIIWNWQLFKSFEVNVVGNEYRIPKETRLDPRIPPEGIPYNIVTTLMSGYEESMRANERIMKKVAGKHKGRVLGKREAQKIAPGGAFGWNELYGKYHPLEPTFFGLGRYLAWIVLTEPNKVKELEKWAVKEFSKFNSSPVCYYSQPFDFGRAMFFRIFVFADPKNQKLVDHIVAKYREMYDVAMQRYGGVPLRVKMGFPDLGVVGGYGQALAKIKHAFDPNNVLSPNMGIFPEVTL
jgi:FAD/FMN-containing dehydrogenase